jgi:EmrB/QacA subfamily drug resistance transporter
VTANDPTPVGASTAGKHRGLALLVIAGAQLMIVLDGTIVNVALPTIHADLRFSAANLEWLITAYALTFGGLLLFGGRTGDLYGRRRMFMVGIAVFAAASLLGGFAQDDIWLILTRGAQGIGGAIAAPTALSLIATNFPEGKERNRAMGVYAATAAGGGALGLLLGGVFTDAVSWRWIFFVNVPIGALILLLAPRALSESETATGNLDLPGVLTSTAGMLALVYGLSNAGSQSWGSLGTVIPLIAAAVLLASFVFIESASRDPIMPLGLFKDWNRSGTYILMLCIITGLFTMFYFLAQFVQNILGWSPIKTGLGFLPMSVGIVIGAALASALIGKAGIRVPLLIGPAAAVAGLLWFSRLTPYSTYPDILGPLLLISLGMGLAFVPLTLTAVSGVPEAETGIASALVNAAQQIGGALGLAVLATVAIDVTNSKARSLAAAAGGHLSPAGQAVATTHGYTTAFEIGAAVVFVGLIVSLLVIRAPAAQTPAGVDAQSRRTEAPTP